MEQLENQENMQIMNIFFSSKMEIHTCTLYTGGSQPGVVGGSQR